MYSPPRLEWWMKYELLSSPRINPYPLSLKYFVTLPYMLCPPFLLVNEIWFSCYMFFRCCYAPLTLYKAHIDIFWLFVSILHLIISGTKISPQLTIMRLYTPISYGLMVMSESICARFSFPAYFYIMVTFLITFCKTILKPLILLAF